MGIERQMESATRLANPFHAVEVGVAGLLLLPAGVAAFAAASDDGTGLWNRGNAVAWSAIGASVVVIAIATILRNAAGRALEPQRSTTTRRAVTEASPALRAAGSTAIILVGTAFTAMGIGSAAVDYGNMGSSNMTRGVGLAFVAIAAGVVMIVGGATLLSRAVFGVHLVPVTAVPATPPAQRPIVAAAVQPVVVNIDGRRIGSPPEMLVEFFTALGWPQPEVRALTDLATALQMPGARPLQLVWHAHQVSRSAMGAETFGDLLRQLNQVSQQSFLAPTMVAFSFTLA